MRVRALTLACAVGLCAVALPTERAAAQEIMIEDPWARASLGDTPNSAAYMRLEAMGTEGDRLIGGSTPAAETVELHTHIMEDGVAKMRPVEAIEVTPGTPTVLEPGGLHVMLIDLTGPLEEGTMMPLTLVFESAGEVALEVPVKGMAGMGHGGMDHGEMDEGAMDHGEGHGEGHGEMQPDTSN